jgi:nucleoside-diphosphate-sugar epimerase
MAARPLTHYGRSKLRAEQLLPGELKDTVPYTIVRPPAIYGPRDLALRPLFSLAAYGIAPGLGGRRFNLLHVRDVVRGLFLAAEAEAAAGRTYFLADEHGYGYPDLARSMAQAYGRRIRRVPVPDFLLDVAAILTEEAGALLGRPPVFGRDKARELKARWWLASAARARRELGWAPRIPLDEGMRETARWYAQKSHV